MYKYTNHANSTKPVLCFKQMVGEIINYFEYDGC